MDPVKGATKLLWSALAPLNPGIPSTTLQMDTTLSLNTSQDEPLFLPHSQPLCSWTEPSGRDGYLALTGVSHPVTDTPDTETDRASDYPSLDCGLCLHS